MPIAIPKPITHSDQLTKLIDFKSEHVIGFLSEILIDFVGIRRCAKQIEIPQSGSDPQSKSASQKWTSPPRVKVTTSAGLRASKRPGSYHVSARSANASGAR
jgi:hypothetical protein